MRYKKSERILIAEDEFLVSEMIRAMAEEAGYTVVGRAADGREALELASSLKPDVVLMDISMPDMDGIEAARRVQASCPVPVVILSAYELPDLVRRASEAGVGAYLIKPSNPQELERAVTIAIARFGDLLELRRLNAELQARNQELQEALDKVKTLRGLLPICSSCKKIRDDQGYWHQLEAYIRDHSEADFSHGLCPECARRLYPEFYKY